MDDENSGSLRAQRARLTCTECHRRKIKCDKNIPCGTCIKRGLASHCSREENVGTRPTPVAQTPEESGISNNVVLSLLDRISQLESRLQAMNKDVSHELPREQSTHAPQLINTEPGQFTPNAELASPGDVNDGSDAATVLEFLAWGRKKDADFVHAPEHESGPRRHSFGDEEDSNSYSNILATSVRNAQLDVLAALLPSRECIHLLIGYHNNSLLWYHGSYLSSILANDLSIFFTEYVGNIRHEKLNLQWLALLFSILTGSMTCASQSTYLTWGFSSHEKQTLSLRWYEAAITCLNMANYIEIHTIYSVQAIATLTISAHILGHSDSQSVLLASAGRIAQSLGLHRLGADATSSDPEHIRKFESGRRVFIQLCTQDWFSIPFSESYTLNPRFCSTIKPLNCNDDDLVVHPAHVPTQASYCNYRYDIACLMPRLLDAMQGCNTLYTKYEVVLKYDEMMRKLATAYMPTFLSTSEPVAVNWPVHTRWGRRSLAICAAHKIIMIHRKFLALSFTNTAFTFTRRTCLAASKTILKEAFAAIEDADAPILWIEQAFAVAAGIILTLDTFHRAPNEKEYEEHSRLVGDTIEWLKEFEGSRIAMRGVRLLGAMMMQQEEKGEVESVNTTSTSRADSRKRLRTVGESSSSPVRKKARGLNTRDFVRDISQRLRVGTPTAETRGRSTSDGHGIGHRHSHTEDYSAWDAFNEFLPPQTGLGGQDLFESFFLERSCSLFL